MSSETISLGQLAPDRCQSCSTHTCGRADSPLAESSPLADSSPLASSPRRGAPVLHEIPVYEIDNGEHSRTCIRKEDFNCNDIDTDHSHFVGYHTQINLLTLASEVKSKSIFLDLQ